MEELAFDEYAALTLLRVTVRALRRHLVRETAFRSPLIRRLVMLATDVLEEVCNEIERSAPEFVAAENRRREEEPDVLHAAESGAGRRLTTIAPAASTPSPPPVIPPPAPPEPRPVAKPRPECYPRPNHWTKKPRTCPHCQISGKGPQFVRHHFAQCPKKLKAEGELRESLAIAERDPGLASVEPETA